MFRLNQLKPISGRTTRTACAAAVASIVLLTGCGDSDNPAQVEPAQVDPEPTTDDLAHEDPCELPSDLIAEKPWITNIPC